MYAQAARQWANDQRQLTELEHQFLIKLQHLYEVLVEERQRGDPTISRWSGLAHFHVGKVFQQALANWAEAERSYARAITVQEQLCRQYPQVEVYRRDLATSLNWRRVLLQERGYRPEEAEQVHRRLLELQEELATAESTAEPEEWMPQRTQPYLPVIVFAGSSAEAGIFQAFLESQGINTQLGDEFLGAVAPYLAAGGGVSPVKVLVPQEVAARARELLAGRQTLGWDTVA
jgi:hypothetical protein